MEKRKFSRRDFLKVSATVSAGTLAAASTTAFANAAGSAPAQANTELVIWYWADYNREVIDNSTDNAEALWWKWIFDQFEAANPNTTIRVESHGWEDVLRSGLLNAIAGGSAPDVTHGEAFIQEFVALGALEAVDVNPDDFPRGAIAGAIHNGAVYGVPAMTSSFALEINPSVLEKSGLDPDDTPRTWDALLANADAIFQAGDGGENWFGFAVFGPTVTSYNAALRAMPWVNRTGVLMTSDDGLTPTFNDPGSIPAYELMRELFRTADVGAALSEDERKIGSVVWENRAAYQVSPAWNARYASEAEVITKFVPLPMFRGDGAVAGNVVVGNITFSPVKTGANPQLGVKFVEFLAEEETQWQVAKTRGFFLPAHKNVLADPQVTIQGSYGGYEANTQVIVDVLLNEETHPIPPFARNGSTIWTEWSNRFGRVLLTDESITDILDEMQAKAEELLA